MVQANSSRICLAMDIIPNWAMLQVGDNISFVGQSIVLDNKGDHLFKSTDASRQHLVIRGSIPDAVVCTFLDLQIVQVEPMVIGSVMPHTKVWPCPPCHVADLYRLTELCCGMGAFSSMGPLAGFEVLLGIDENPKWKTLFENIHSNSAAYLIGDIGNTAQIDDMLTSGAMHSTILAGISCQPHSTGGDMGGMRDSRSSTLHKALKVGWLIQAPILILECVPGVLTNADFQQVLREHCSMIGACLTQQIVKLSNVWCARRDRWFACVTSAILGPINIPDLPIDATFDTIEKVMPAIMKWPQTDMDQIVLSLYELSKFHTYVKGGIQNSFLQMSGQLPTSLHSAGNQLYACRCGCRKGLSLSRLQEHGLYGVLIQLGTSIEHDGCQLHECRYLHPCEMFLLNGGLPSIQCDPDLRLSMAAIGQFVSPIQGLWILGHVAKHVAGFLNQPVQDPLQVLKMYLEKVIQSRDKLWGPTLPPSGNKDGHSTVQEMVVPDCNGLQVRFAASQKATVEDFLKAESELHSCTLVCQDWQWQCSGEVSSDTCLTQVEFQESANQTTSHLPFPEFDKPEVPAEVEIMPTVSYSIQDDRNQTAIPALLKLKGSDFLVLAPPMVDSISGIHSMRQQLISQTARSALLENQGAIWGDDEIFFALNQIASAGSHEQGIVTWDPLLLSAVVRSGQFQIIRELVNQLPEQATVITAFVVDKHWHPMVWRFDQSGVYAYTCGLLHAFSLAHQALQSEICKIRAVPATQVHNRPLPFIVNEKCGAMAIAYIRHLTHSLPMPNNAQDLTQIHAQLRQVFGEWCQDVTPRPWLWANGQEECKSQLATLLQEHGVPVSDASKRVHLIIEKLGFTAVEQSIKASNPWRELKWHANQLTPQFQLIRPSELQSVLDQKIASGKSVGNRSQKINKSKGKGKGKQSDIDPHKLRLEQGVFICGADQRLSQIDLSQVGPATNGIVLCDAVMSAPYLKAGKQLSAGGLAFIVLAASDTLPPTALISEKVRIPVVCAANSEPLLIDGYLYQLGAQPVRRNITQDRFKLESVASCVGKFAIFRDQIDIPWEQFIQHPLKHLFSKVPVLQTCPEETCGGHCEMWHPCEACRLTDPILEIWNKQWLTYGFASASPEKAEVYSVCIRLPVSVQMQVQAYSGIAGIFVEPRSIDGRQPSDQFQVVWVKVSNQELVLLRQTHPSVCGLARMGMKQGLRCRIEHAATLHASVKPTSSFLPQGRKCYYLVGPLPYGTVKASLTEALLTVGWKIRPLQTVATSKHVEGIMWKVQAVDDPPRSVIQLEHGEVLVTKLEDHYVHAASSVQVVGSDRTKQLCSSNAKGSDPLQQNDPWAAWSKVSTNSVAIAAEAPLANLEQKVYESVMAKLPREAMEVDDGGAVDKRILNLEQQVMNLQEGQQQLSHRVQEQGQTQGNQIQQLYAQSTRLEATVHEQSAALGQFQTQFRAQLEQQQGQLDTLFRKQMDRIEEILHTKKQRHE